LTYTVNDIAHLIKASVAESSLANQGKREITQLVIDSRKAYEPENSLFFALVGAKRDGHDFIGELYKKGVRAFVISASVDQNNYPEAVFLCVVDTLAALQLLATQHRKKFTYPVIGITGSNGKTIVKEWLFHLLQSDYTIVRSPKSYNSQIGVPLSIWQMQSHHTLGIFEAGISAKGEMQKLETVIQPTIGLLTSIGEAHSQGFASLEEKVAEKKLLFKNSVVPGKLMVTKVEFGQNGTTITAKKADTATAPDFINIPFTDEASIQNAVTCWELLLHLGYDSATIRSRMRQLPAVDMRLTLKKGINHCVIINDSYSADISSLEMALTFLSRQAGMMKKTVVLSDFLQSAIPAAELYKKIAGLLTQQKVSRLIVVGEEISTSFTKMKQEIILGSADNFPFTIEYFANTAELVKQFHQLNFREEAILIKGARVFEFEKLVQLLEQKMHQTRLEINFSALVHNLNQYHEQLKPGVKVMAMVKAFAYGSGAVDVASVLQFQKVDYLGVAYADEGVELRKAGIVLPIMVMNPEPASYEKIIDYHLEPAVFSFEELKSFADFLTSKGIEHQYIHVEVETGMNRLGFSLKHLSELTKYLLSNPICKVRSVFSHLVASEDAAQDVFTNEQLEKYTKAVHYLENELGYSFIKHIANSAGAIRNKDLQLDMVRLGIGLYGIEPTKENSLSLQNVATLKSTVAQVKALLPGESVSYNRRAIVDKPTLIATVRIGYADGYPRRLGNGVGSVLIQNKLFPIIGTVCMDMLMVDVTNHPNIKEGDEVILFGADLPVTQVAAWADTIPYEILAAVSQRVKRIYFEE
jgi:alanine racemase